MAKILNTFSTVILATTLLATQQAYSAFAIFNITSSGTTTSNSFANGDVYLGTDLVGTFSLTKNVLNAGSYGDAIFRSGTSGAGTVPTGSEDTGIGADLLADNTSISDSVGWTISINTNAGYQVQSLVLSDFLRNSLDGPSNQQDADIVATWTGGDATLSDPGGAGTTSPDGVIDLGIAGNGTGQAGPQGTINDGDTFSSGTVLHRRDDNNTHITSDPAWSISVPASEVTISYTIESAGEQNNLPPNNNGFREQFGFQANIVAVPEPSALILSSLGLLGLTLRRKR